MWSRFRLQFWICCMSLRTIHISHNKFCMVYTDSIIIWMINVYIKHTTYYVMQYYLFCIIQSLLSIFLNMIIVFIYNNSGFSKLRGDLLLRFNPPTKLFAGGAENFIVGIFLRFWEAPKSFQRERPYARMRTNTYKYEHFFTQCYLFWYDNHKGWKL